MRARWIVMLAMVALLSSCGLKRNLELPGHEKHKAAGDDSGSSATDTTNTNTANTESTNNTDSGKNKSKSDKSAANTSTMGQTVTPAQTPANKGNIAPLIAPPDPDAPDPLPFLNKPDPDPVQNNKVTQ